MFVPRERRLFEVSMLRVIRCLLFGLAVLFASIISVAASEEADPGCSEGKELRRGRDWINANLEEIARQPDAAVVPKDDVYEVLASKLLFALDDLVKKEIKPLTEAEALLLAGHHYRNGSGKKAYLVRAVWVGEMPFHVSTSGNGDVLMIQDGSVGDHRTPFMKSALVVNLTTPPEKVLVGAYVY